MAVKKFQYNSTDRDLQNLEFDKDRDKIIKKIANYIGFIIIDLNSIESSTEYFFKELLSNNEFKDEIIAVILTKLQYGQKTTTLLEICSIYIHKIVSENKKEQYFEKLEGIKEVLTKSGSIRNQYAHAFWEEIATNNLVKTKTRVEQDGVYNLFKEFAIEAMEEDSTYVKNASLAFDDFVHDLLQEVSTIN